MMSRVIHLISVLILISILSTATSTAAVAWFWNESVLASSVRNNGGSGGGGGSLKAMNISSTILRMQPSLIHDLLDILQGSVNLVSVKDEKLVHDVLFAYEHSDRKADPEQRVENIYYSPYAQELWLPYILQHHDPTKKMLFTSSVDTFASLPPLFHFVTSRVYAYSLYAFFQRKQKQVSESGLNSQDIYNYWQRIATDVIEHSGWDHAFGLDFIIPTSHPMTVLNINDKSFELNVLAHATFLVTDYDSKGRYPKDLIIPHLLPSTSGSRNKALTSRRRILLLFFGITTQSLRKQLYQAFESIARTGEQDVVILTAENEVIVDAHLHASKFCLMLRGDTTTASHLFTAINSGCVPVLVSDWIALPFESILNYPAFTIQIEESFLLNQPEQFLAFMRSIPEAQIETMRALTLEVAEFFTYSPNPSQEVNVASLILLDALINRIHHCSNILGNTNLPIEQHYSTDRSTLCSRLQFRISDKLGTVDIFDLQRKLTKATSCISASAGSTVTRKRNRRTRALCEQS